MSMIATMLESTCVIQRPTIGRDSAQGVTQTFVTIATDVPCCLGESGGGPDTFYGQRSANVGTTVYFANDPETEVNDRLLITDKAGSTAYYLVDGESQSSTGRCMLWQVNAKRIRQPV